MNNDWYSYKLGTKSWWGLDPRAWFKDSLRYNWDVSEAWRLAIKNVSDGMIAYSAHTDPRRNQALSEKIGNETVFIIRIRN